MCRGSGTIVNAVSASGLFRPCGCLGATVLTSGLCRRRGCFGPSRHLVSGVLICTSLQIPRGARKNKTVISNILQRKLAFANRNSVAKAQALRFKLCRILCLRLRLIELFRPRAVSASKRAPVHGGCVSSVADADEWGGIRRGAPLGTMGACRGEHARD